MEGRLRMRIFALGGGEDKKVKRRRTAWKKYWCTIDRGLFIYSRKFRDLPSSNCVAIHQLSCEAVPETVSGRKYVFAVNFGSAVFWCQAAGALECARWQKVFIVKAEFLNLRRSFNWNDERDLCACAPRLASMLALAVSMCAKSLVAEITGTINYLFSIAPAFMRAFVSASGLVVLVRALGEFETAPKEIVRAVSSVSEVAALHVPLIQAGVFDSLEKFSRHGGFDALAHAVVRLLVAADIQSVRKTMCALKSSAAVQLIPILVDAAASYATAIDRHLKPEFVANLGALSLSEASSSWPAIPLHAGSSTRGRLHSAVSDSRASVSPEPLRPRHATMPSASPHGPAGSTTSTVGVTLRCVPRLSALAAASIVDHSNASGIIGLRAVADSLHVPILNDFASLVLVFSALERLAEESKFRTKLTRPLRSLPFLRSAALKSRPIARLFARIVHLLSADARHEVHRVAWAKGRREGALPCLEPLIASDAPSDHQLCVQLVSVLSSHLCCGHRIARDSQGTALDALVRLARMGDADCLKTLCDMVKRELAPALIRAKVPSALRAMFLDANVGSKLRFLASEALDSVRELRLEQWQPSHVVISELACFTSTRSLSLKGSYIGDGVVSSLAAYLPALTTINFAMTSITDAEFALLVPNTRSLRSLVVPTQCGDAAVKALMPLAQSLEELDLAICRITPACFPHLCRLVALRDLNLFSTATNNECARMISQSLVNLRRLNLCMTRVTDEGAASLASLVHLTHLNLKNTDLHAPTAIMLKSLLLDMVDLNVDFTSADPRMFAS